MRFLLKNLHFLLKNVDFLLKNVDFITKIEARTDAASERLIIEMERRSNDLIIEMERQHATLLKAAKTSPQVRFFHSK